jgi:hypothetical protein
MHPRLRQLMEQLTPEDDRTVIVRLKVAEGKG